MAGRLAALRGHRWLGAAAGACPAVAGVMPAGAREARPTRDGVDGQGGAARRRRFVRGRR